MGVLFCILDEIKHALKPSNILCLNKHIEKIKFLLYLFIIYFFVDTLMTSYMGSRQGSYYQVTNQTKMSLPNHELLRPTCTCSTHLELLSNW